MALGANDLDNPSAGPGKQPAQARLLRFSIGRETHGVIVSKPVFQFSLYYFTTQKT